MNRLLVTLLAALTLSLGAQAREITDMAGRHVVIPDRIERVFGAAPPLNVLLHAVAPETMLGLSFPVPPEARPYFPERLRGLPVVGGVFGMGQQMNPESVLMQKPDVALAWKSPFIDQARIESAFARIGLPVVFVQLDTTAEWPAALRFTGRLLGHEAKAEEEARAVEQVLARVGKVVNAVPEAQRPRVYYAEGPDGLATDCHRSFHTEAIELAGGYNVFRCEPKDHMGMERVSIEQVLAFAPDIIIAQDRNFVASVGKDARWRGVKAVQAGRVLVVPRWPHNWIDRPPSIMRVLGIQWLANQFYPQAYPFELRRETREFYQRFLGVSLSDAEIDALFR
ncbi:ABC transporter substrate-binding protein [Rhodocyclus tenuis]|uniref:Iron complex transport system substrate-binding protein n=1 Tax=Rhodocyclus tenuis TaxID=1066 RepID=A0A840GA04_RHOTE|nr:ABC transporter substrate-binding protein [Rhodocyclus tenuis]MBB4248676.1 iron complex transport system substrate-binding protein [Rhodocyclus tenuis]